MPLITFLAKKETPLGPDLGLTRCYGRFRAAIKRGESIRQAMDMVTLKEVKDLAEAIGKPSDGGARDGASSQPVCPKEELEDGIDTSVDAVVGLGGLRKKRRGKRGTTPIGDYFLGRVQADPSTQYGKMVVHCVLLELHGIQAPLVDNQAILKSTVGSIMEVFKSWVRQLRDAGYDSNETGKAIGAIINAAAIVLRSALEADADRPPVDERRGARGSLITASRKTGLDSEIAKAFQTFPGCVEAANASQRHSRMGLEDDAAANVLEAGIAKLEEHFDLAFTCMDDFIWTGTGAQEVPMQVESVASGVLVLKAAAGSVAMATQRFSAAGFFKHASRVQDLLLNLAATLDVSNFIACLHVAEVMLGPLEVVLQSHNRSCRGDNGGTTIAVGQAAEDTQLAMLTDGTPQASVAADVVADAPAADQETRCYDLDLNGALFDENSAAAERLRKVVMPLFTGLKETGGYFANCKSAVELKSTSDWSKFLEEMTVSFSEYTKRVDNNLDAVEKIAEYIIACGNLAGQLRAAGERGRNASLDLEMQKPDDLVVRFSRLHNNHLSNGTLHIQYLDVADGSNIDRINSIFNEYVEKVGTFVYDEFFTKSIEYAVGSITSVAVQVMVAQVGAVRSAKDEDQLPYLIRGPPLDEIRSRFGTLPFMGAAAHDDTLLEKLEHNRVYDFLKSFMSATSTLKMTIPGCTHHDGRLGGLDVADALHVLFVDCLVADIAALGAQLQSTLVLPTVEGKTLSEADAVHKNTSMVLALKKSIGRLEEVIHSEATSKVESVGWTLHRDLSTTAAWCGLIPVFANTCQTFLLRQFNMLLLQATKKLKGVTPVYSAAFQDGRFDLVLATSLLNGEAAKVATAHNVVHALLVQISTAAGTHAHTSRLGRQSSREANKTGHGVTVCMHSLPTPHPICAYGDGTRCLYVEHLPPCGPYGSN